MATREPCILTESVSCGCEWLYVPHPIDRSVRYQHGDSREHVLIIGESRMRNAPMCSEGHVRDFEEWAARVVKYVHPQ